MLDRIRKWPYTIFATWCFAVVAIQASLFALVVLWFPGDTETIWAKRGQFGDVFGVVNALFSGLAFAGIIYTILLQREELREQRTELALTRAEFEEQNSTLAAQRFETTFFQLLRTHSELVGAMRRTEGMQEWVGRERFGRFVTLLSEFFNATDAPGGRADATRARWAYARLFNARQDELGHYFENMYYIIKFVDTSDITDKQQYVDFLRAQLSQHELTVLLYHLDSPQGAKMRELAEKYALLKNLALETLRHENDLKLVEPETFGRSQATMSDLVQLAADICKKRDLR